jgi:hypothetical protein
VIPVIINETNVTTELNNTIANLTNSTNSSSTNETEADDGFEINKTSLYIGLAAGATVLFIVGIIAMICWICYCKRKWPEWQKVK